MATLPLSRNLNVLVVDDEPMMQRYVRSLLEVEGYHVDTASTGLDALQRVQHGSRPDLIFLDLLMPGLDGLQTLEKLRQLSPNVKVVILSCISDTRKVAQAIRMGALDYVTKPFCKQDLDSVLQFCFDKLSGGPTELIDFGDGSCFVTASLAMHRIRSRAELVAKFDVPVLILGESGTGKEVLARLIHSSSTRANGSFLKINCAAVPDDLLESELFGYERGAFTGATHTKPGKFELCNKGTILLDEIGEMSPALQAKLLHVLQDERFTRLGGSSEIKVDVRVIAATNIDIQQALATKKLRQDLYYRLNAFTFQVPPLRERKCDIPVLLKHLMGVLSERYSRPQLPLPPAVLNACLNYPWPGNVRELENLVKRSLVLGDLQLVAAELNISGEQARARSGSANSDKDPGNSDPGSEKVSGDLKRLGQSAKAQAEVVAIIRSLQQTDWNRRRAAELLMISYKALLYKIREYEIERPLKQYS